MSDQAATTLREVFRFLHHTYSYDLRSPRLVEVISGVFHLSTDQTRRALQNLEERKLIEVARNGDEVVEVLLLAEPQAPVPNIPV